MNKSRGETMEENNLKIGRIPLQNKAFSLMYSVQRTSKGMRILLKLYNNIEDKPVSRMSSIILNEQEIPLLVKVLQNLTGEDKDNVQS
jgi:DNA-binding protein Fis